MAWAFLVVAIVCEVFGTASLRMAALGEKRWYAGVLAGYAVAFTCLSLTLRAGMPLGMAYGVWAAVGVALTALVSRVVFREPFSGLMAGGIALIAGGVLLIELGSTTPVE